MVKESNQGLPADMEQLAKSLSEELDLYKQIHKLTKTQTDQLDKDDIDAFNSSLDKRAELIEKIKGLHQESEPLKQSYISFTKKENKSDSKLDDLLDQIKNIIESCAKLNGENIASLEEKTKEQSKKIDEQRAKGKTIGGYVQSVPNIPEVFDKKT